MFSFHKPKVYRSSTGCCICRAKSSSSRFTDSKKYEDDFIECFQLKERRNGEICNACVLLVKRWKKLPAGSERNWRHVVDARAGPGTKSLSKFKSMRNKKKPKRLVDHTVKTSEDQENSSPSKRKKHIYRKLATSSGCSSPVQTPNTREQSPSALSDEIQGDECDSDLEDLDEEDLSQPTSPTSSIEAWHRNQKRVKSGTFVDDAYWKRDTTCCGDVYFGRQGEIMIDLLVLKPCGSCPIFKSPAQSRPTTPTLQAKNVSVTLLASGKDIDSSSDSGYDDSSNPSSVAASITQEQVSQLELNQCCRPAVIQATPIIIEKN